MTWRVSKKNVQERIHRRSDRHAIPLRVCRSCITSIVNIVGRLGTVSIALMILENGINESLGNAGERDVVIRDRRGTNSTEMRNYHDDEPNETDGIGCQAKHPADKEIPTVLSVTGSATSSKAPMALTPAGTARLPKISHSCWRRQ